MGNWGISEKASDKEKLKAEMADYLGGLNSCAIINYETYSNAFDFTMDLLNRMYEINRLQTLDNKDYSAALIATIKNGVNENMPPAVIADNIMRLNSQS